MGVPAELFGEVYGSEKSKKRFRPNVDVECPFNPQLAKRIKPGCTKTSERAKGKTTGNCSLNVNDNPHIICPHRFYYDNFRIFHDIKKFIWGKVGEVEAYAEIGLLKTVESEKFRFGNLDWVLVRKDDPSKFIGIEVQANNTSNTGSVQNAIEDLINDETKDNYKVSLNTLDSIKKFITQFIFKGQLFDDWKMPYVAVIQDELWKPMAEKFKIRSRIVKEFEDQTFLFFIYKMYRDGDRYVMRLQEIRASRWIDFLIAYAVDTELLITRKELKTTLQTKIQKNDPVLTL